MKGTLVIVIRVDRWTGYTWNKALVTVGRGNKWTGFTVKWKKGLVLVREGINVSSNLHFFVGFYSESMKVI